MEINPREVQIYYINLPEHQERKDLFLKRMTDAGFDVEKIIRVDGIRKEGIPNDNVFVGCFHSQLKALKMALDGNFPFVILEDDAAINKIPEIIEIPDTSDALYIGISSWGFVPSPDGTLSGINRIITDRFNKDIVRIFNMLSSHAILYVNREYVKNLISDLESNLSGVQQKSVSTDIGLKYYGGNLLPCDIIMANRQYSGEVYALRNPIFYQDDKHQYCTLFNL
jgi:hypothetical protein